MRHRRASAWACLLGFLLALSASPALAGTDGNTSRKADYFFYEGLKLKQEGKYDAAYDAFTHCLELDTASASVLYELSSFYVQRGNPDRALEYLRKAVTHSPDNYTYRMALANVARRMEMYAEAAGEYEALLKRYPDKPELNYYLAETLTGQGELAAAIEAFDALEEAIGMNEAISLEKYKLYSSLEQPEKAFREIERLAEKYPEEARYRLTLGDLHLEKGEYDQALAAYEKAHEIDPGNPNYTVCMAAYYEATGNKDAAETEVQNALVDEKLDVDTKVGILSRYILRLQQTRQGAERADSLFGTLLEQHPEDINLKLMYGSLLLAQKKDDEARFQFRLVTEMAPENQSAWQQLLSLALRSEDVGEIVRLCRRCIELFPRSPEYYFYLGIGYFQQEKYREALETYQNGLNAIPKENVMMISDFYGQIGDLHYQMGDLQQAYEAYDEALKYNERNVVVLNNYSYFLTQERRDLKRAERMSAQCIRLEPDNATYLDTYAWVFFAQGNYALARIYIESALSKDSSGSAELVEHYGDILFMCGEKDKAVEQWKKAREMGKESEELERKINDKQLTTENGKP